MKRLCAILVMLALLLSLSACGKSDAVVAVEDQIAALDTEITLDSGDAVTAARTAYDALEEKDQKKVENYEILTTAETAYDECVVEAEHEQALSDYRDMLDTCNETIEAYNLDVDLYNGKAADVNSANAQLADFLASIKESGIYDETAYDSNTITTLLESAANAELSLAEDIELKDYTEEESEPATLETAETETLEEMTEELSAENTDIGQQTLDLESATEEIVIPDYTETITAVQTDWDAAAESVKIEQQITNPSEAFVISRLGEIPDITDIAPVTEDHDPNGQLHKQGGYTSAVYFSLSYIEQSSVYGDNLIDKGTDAGGCIEVYETAEYAESRDTYLGAFDGGMFSSGSHTVLGTIVVRTSNELTASQQQVMEEMLIAVMIRLDD